MTRTTFAGIAVALVASLLARPVPATPGPASGVDDGSVLTAERLTDEHLVAAIDAITAELYERRHPDRHWEPSKPPSGESQRQGGGTTALVVLSLLYAGQSYQDPRLRDAVEFIERYEMEGTYAVAVRAHVWARLPERFRPALEADARWLLEAFSPRSLGWDYGHDPRGRYRDNSLRQYAALGLWEAAKRDVAVPPRLWEALERAILECQLADGGWNYAADDKPPRGSMTTAGLTVLFITQDLLHRKDHARIERRREPGPHELALQRGLEWMERRFSPSEHPGSAAHFYYYLYGVERVGLASGYKFFGRHDWFREGAAELLKRICAWDPEGRRMAVRDRRIASRDLAFALMFLCRGRAPIAVNKLQVPGFAWNHRPRDAANLARALSDRTERELSWQIVSFDADPGEWLDAPLLYLASNEALPWMPAGGTARRADAPAANAPAADAPAPGAPAALPAPLAKLRSYLDQGGLLVALSEGGRGLPESVRAIGDRLYPDLTWRELPDDHWVFDLYEPVGRRSRVLALGNGVRELILLMPRDDIPSSLQTLEGRASEAHVRLLTNIYFHASEMNRPRPRLGRGVVRSAGGDGADAAPLTVVRASYDGAWCPEPAALPAFARWLDAAHGRRVTLVDRPLADVGDDGAALVVCSGIAPRTLDERELQAIARHVGRGGTILFETPGGLGAFAQAAERQLSARLGVEPALLGDDAIITGADLDRGSVLARVGYRPFAVSRFGVGATSPRLRGLVIDGAPRVLFSNEDLSHALLDRPCWGVSGYTTDSARRLLWNIVQRGARLRAADRRSDGQGARP